MIQTRRIGCKFPQGNARRRAAANRRASHALTSAASMSQHISATQIPKLRIAIAPNSSSPGERPVQPDHYQFWPAHLPREMPLPETSLYQNLETTATRFPDKPVVQYYGTPLTYRQFKDDVDALAGFLQRRSGVTRGE